jgi:hypothetical protein
MARAGSTKTCAGGIKRAARVSEGVSDVFGRVRTSAHKVVARAFALT